MQVKTRKAFQSSHRRRYLAGKSLSLQRNICHFPVFVAVDAFKRTTTWVCITGPRRKEPVHRVQRSFHLHESSQLWISPHGWQTRKCKKKEERKEETEETEETHICFWSSIISSSQETERVRNGEKKRQCKYLSKTVRRQNLGVTLAFTFSVLEVRLWSCLADFS